MRSKHLQWIAANRVDKPVGTIIYTQMLNDNGGIECDLNLRSDKA
jgi:4-methylaminobutanoate oxidase (formaldehyde-forming)